MRITYAPRFQHALKKHSIEFVEKIVERVLLFKQNPFDFRLHTHKLHGKLKSKWSFSVDNRFRILFEFDMADHSNAIFLDIGDHDLYR